MFCDKDETLFRGCCSTNPLTVIILARTKYIQMPSNIEYSGEQDFECSQKWLVNTDLECFCVTFSNINFNPFPNKPWFLRVCCTSLLKTVWEKEKLLLTSNFSFSHSVFHPFGNFLPFLSNLKLLSANYFSLEESKISVQGHQSRSRSNFKVAVFY